MLFTTVISGFASAQPQLQSDTTLATAGYFQLSWPDDSTHSFEVQQANNPAFANALTIYQGHDHASVISGLPNGQYYYRVRSPSDTNWSEPVKVVVTHHPLSRAFGFFSLGAIMFIATVTVLIRGARRQHNL